MSILNLDALKQYINDHSVDTTEASAIAKTEVQNTITRDDTLQSALDRNARTATQGPTRTIGSGEYETPVYVVDSGRPGPTAYVVAGQHGDEPSGYRTADKLSRARLANGRLVVVPRANLPACKADVHNGKLGTNMNRTWADDGPTRDISRALWADIQSEDPDVVLDLHSSHGIYRSTTADGVGQSVFPTPAGVGDAGTAVDKLNEQYLKPIINQHGWSGDYTYIVGNEQNEVGDPKLIDHVGRETNWKGYIVESTRYKTSLNQRTNWTYAVSRYLLEEAGLVLS